jgi:predicted RND superfamily exporter protein
MKRFGNAIVKLRIPILILALLLLIPSTIGYMKTKVNYDMLVYLPQNIDTMKGQNILKDEFGTGAFASYIVEGMSEKQTADLKAEIEEVPHVKKVLWYDSVMDLSVPMEMLPDDLYKAFNSGDATMMFIIFDETTSEDGTVAAARQIRQISNEKCFLAGMTATLIDTEDLSNKEAPIYIGLAVLLSTIVLSLTMDSFLVPFVFLASIGMAIIYNLGTNIFLGSISYVTKSLAAVLQLGVTMDYSIFLWHSYEHYLEVGEKRDNAMALAIADTFSSIIGSSITTIAGFVALCFMSFTLGLDLGVVMAKGVLFGVVSCVTILPSMILVFDKALRRTRHKALLPDIRGIGHFVTKHYRLFLAVFALLLVPALYGYNHTQQYYDLAKTLPENLPGVVANNKLDDEFNMSTTHILMINSDIEAKEIQRMSDEMKGVDGVKWVLGLNTMKGAALPDSFIPDDLRENFENDHWQILLIGSEYATASNECNAQIDKLESIAKNYDRHSMLIGEAPATKDLIQTTATDFGVVNTISIGVIFFIILMVFKSVALPFILVAVIEFGIFINLGIPFYTGTKLPFIASIVIGTIQLGSTVDYAILTTTRYIRERSAGSEKRDAIATAIQASTKSIMVSALTFFGATFGVGLYSDIDLISSLCILMARGAVISLGCVVGILPAFLVIFDGLVVRTTAGLSERSKARRAKLRNKLKEIRDNG